MSDDSNERANAERRIALAVEPIERLLTSIYDVAIRSWNTQPMWQILHFVYSASRSAIDLLPAGQESKRNSLAQRCIENMLILSTIADSDAETSVVTGLFGQLRDAGFSSEDRAVACANHYCGWLKSRGQTAMVQEVIDIAGAQIAHPFFKRELELVQKRFIGDSDKDDAIS